MKKLDGYMAGPNLGGWISQYRNYDHEHFKSFIVEEDIKTIASWGADHIRLPVDYPVLEDDAQPGTYLESGFEYIDKAITWSKKYGLNVIIDLHKAPGFFFGNLDSNTLFTDPKMQDRFINLWKAIAARYKGEGANVVYELMNEMVEPDSSRWNPMVERLVKGIREVDTEHDIIVGGIMYNSVNALALLPIIDDPNIIYTFHMYEPHGFTHQKASWSFATKEYDRNLSYPSEMEPHIDFLKFSYERSKTNPRPSQPPVAPEFKLPPSYEGLTRMDKEWLHRFMQPAFDFIKKHDKPLYCGEYGVITHSDMQSREIWHEDVSDILLEYGIGRGVWSYKGMSFTLIDQDRKPVSERLIKAICRH
ncbi:MAG: glycoside hydrolase family 5 protein [Treponema sp.]|nr:glycoside hydrolase family 5 protein [Treponema sp.]